MRKILISLVFVALFLSETSCVKRFNTGVPTSKLSTRQQAQLRIQQSLSIIASTAYATAQITISLNESKLINDEMTQPILQYSRVAAQSAKSVTQILDSNIPSAQKIKNITGILGQLNINDDLRSYLNKPGTDVKLANLYSLMDSILSLRGIILGDLSSL